jgi:ribosome biogenesis protein NSA2
MGLRMNKAHVTHRMLLMFRSHSSLLPSLWPHPTANFLAELKTTFQLPILGVKKNPQSPLYTSLGVLTKGTIIEVNVSELGMVTTGGKVVWSSECRLGIALFPQHSFRRCGAVLPPRR